MKYYILILSVAILSACSTVAGVGKDITGAADWTHDKISKPSVDLKN
jgi:predicted small secreted protein